MKAKKNDNIPETESEKPHGNSTPKEPALILKSGDTDLRRGTKALNKLIETTGNNPHDGNMYAFYNEKDTVKIIQHKSDGDEMLVKKMNELIGDWPEYRPNGEPGYMVVLKGKEKDEFLGRIGCPKKL
jgi:hypothetical protein